jgi:hypothetical protein
MELKQLLIPRNFTPGRSKPIRAIVLHTQAGKGDSLYSWFSRDMELKNGVWYLKATNTKSYGPVSAHYFVRYDGLVEQYVKDSDTAWHAGTFNADTIGVEHMDNGKPEDGIRTMDLYRSSSELIYRLSVKHNIPLVFITKGEYLSGSRGLLLHKDIATDGRSCPGGLDVHRIKNWANDILLENNKPKEDPKMIEELKNTIAQKERELADKTLTIEAKDNIIIDLTHERDTLKFDFDAYKSKVSDEFFKMKSEAETRYSSLEIIKKGLEDKIGEISNADELEDNHYISNLKQLEEEKKLIQEERDKVISEMEELKKTLGSETPTKQETSSFLQWIKQIAFSPAHLAVLHKFLPSPKMFLWKKWGKQHLVKELLQKGATWLMGSSLGATLWIGADALNQIANQPIPDRWTKESLWGFMLGTAVILIKVLKRIAKKNEPIIKAVEQVNPAVDVYKGTDKSVVLKEVSL